MLNKQKGDEYELYIKNYLRSENNYVWLWNDIPEEHLRNIGYIGDWNEHRLGKRENRVNNLPDLGCDILLLNEEKEYRLVQCKNYNSKSVTLQDLGTFYLMIYKYGQNGIVYYTKSISRNIKEQKEDGRIEYIRKPMIVSTVEETQSTTKKVPYYYQLEAYNSLKGKHRAILQLPCGMGKTLTATMVAKDYNQIIFVSPLREHAKQNLKKVSDELEDYKTLLVSSDNKGTRELDEIIDVIDKNDKFILSFTYDSCDLLVSILNKLSNYIVVVDEFHNLSINDVSCDTDTDIDTDIDTDEEANMDIDSDIDSRTPLYKLLHSTARILFLSATPRLFDTELIEGDENDESIFGLIEYSYPMGEAIRKGFICDYNIYVPDLSVRGYIDEEVKNIIMHFEGYEELVLKAKFILRGCYEIGNKKTIIYLSSQEECSKFKEVLLKLNSDYFYNQDIFVESYISETKNRDTVMKDFINAKNKAFLCSVRILDECVDVVECDSIYITKPSDNKIRNIQRLCRANRKDINNPQKIASVYLWCSNEYSESVEMIKHLKEYDDSFTVTKVKIFNDVEIKEKCTEDRDKNENCNYEILDRLIVGLKKAKSWLETLELVKKYIQENGKRPHEKKIETKSLGSWVVLRFKIIRKKLK